MRRRDVLGLLGGTAAWPLEARAQQPERIRHVGVLMNTAENRDQQASLAAFQQVLQQLGWTDGRNVRIDIRWGMGDAERIRSNAMEMVAIADVIVATGNASMGPLLQATRTVPIIFNNVADPVGAGFVDTLARPGGIPGVPLSSASRASNLKDSIPPHGTRLLHCGISLQLMSELGQGTKPLAR